MKEKNLMDISVKEFRSIIFVIQNMVKSYLEYVIDNNGIPLNDSFNLNLKNIITLNDCDVTIRKIVLGAGIYSKGCINTIAYNICKDMIEGYISYNNDKTLLSIMTLDKVYYSGCKGIASTNLELSQKGLYGKFVDLLSRVDNEANINKANVWLCDHEMKFIKFDNLPSKTAFYLVKEYLPDIDKSVLYDNAVDMVKNDIDKLDDRDILALFVNAYLNYICYQAEKEGYSDDDIQELKGDYIDDGTISYPLISCAHQKIHHYLELYYKEDSDFFDHLFDFHGMKYETKIRFIINTI